VTRFWCNAIRHERVYDGNPVQVHVAAGNVRPGMFETWLEIFVQVLAQELAEAQARSWSALAHRIGASMRAAVVDRQRPGEVPILR